jgi:hypothetical protein
VRGGAAVLPESLPLPDGTLNRATSRDHRARELLAWYHLVVDAGVLAALITAFVSIAVAAVSAVLTLRTDSETRRVQQVLSEKQISADKDLERMRSQHEQLVAAEKLRLEAAARLDLSREPLLTAARDLWHRLRNIREGEFLVFYARSAAPAHRAEIAKLSTAFRLARYWGVLEDLYGTTDLLAFERDETTRPVTDLVNRIGRTFASDSPVMGGQQLMMWREEQRAIGELMAGPKAGESAYRYLNFATFAEKYDQTFARWFSGFLDDLLDDGSEGSPRLARLQELLTELVATLEEGRTS